MKTSLITLLPLACLMQGSLAAPTAEAKPVSIAGSVITASELVERQLGTLPVVPSDPTSLPQLGQLSLLVTAVANIVNSIGT